LSESEISARWVEFVAEVRRQRIAVGSVLEAAEFVGVTGSTIRVRANEFTASAITRNKELLQATIQKVFNARGRIEVEAGAAQPRPVKLDAADGATASPDSPKTNEEHPVIQALIRELGAEPL
jgi:hypothetical protein